MLAGTTSPPPFGTMRLLPPKPSSCSAWDFLEKALVSLYGVVGRSQSVYFVGALTEKAACDQVSAWSGYDECPGIDNTPSQGFSNLRDWLNSDNRTSQVPIPWSTDIKYQIYP
jgi:hypothetical protein